MKKKTVLIVDDEEGFARMTKLVLERTGDFLVEIETHSTKAVDRARAVKPDIILLDLIMPEKDGAEVHADLKKDALLHSVPVLYVTSNVSENDTSAGALVETADGLMLPKTTGPEMLIHCIEEAIAGQL